MQIRRRRVTINVPLGNSPPPHFLRADASPIDIIRVICLLIIVYGLTSAVMLSNLTHIESNHQSSKIPFISTESSVKLSELSIPTSLSRKPRVFGYFFDDDMVSSRRPPSRLPVHWEDAPYELYPSKRQVQWEKEDESAQMELENSEAYSDTHNRNVSPYDPTPECQPMHKWQIKSFPTCNTIHEKDLTHTIDPKDPERDQVRLIAHGYFRDVYIVMDHDGDFPLSMKTTRYRRDFDKRLFDKHRMDAIASDRMTPSLYVLPIYGFCGVAGFFALAEGGDLMDRIYHEEEASDENVVKHDGESKYLKRLYYAMDVANAIADLHTIESFDGKFSSIAHADIYPTQFIENDGRFLLNDFNRCQFMYWNTTSNTETCPYIYDDYNAGTFRSPEEYFYSFQTEKIDVYSMGNIFYFLLQGKMPFEDLEEERKSQYVKELVTNGTKPALSGEILMLANTSPSVKALINAMNMCHTFKWEERPLASEVRDYLRNELDAIEAR